LLPLNATLEHKCTDSTVDRMSDNDAGFRRGG
jgi:hypothetical protein